MPIASGGTPSRWRPSPDHVVGILAVLWLLSMAYALRVHNAALTNGLDVLLLVVGPLVAFARWQRLRAASRRQLARTETSLRVMSAAAGALSWSCDRDGRLTSPSAELSRLFGYEQSEMTRLTLWDLVQDDDRPRLAALLAAGRGWTGQRWRCVHRDGSALWVSGSAVPDTAPDGTVLGFIGSTHPLGTAELDEQRRSETSSAIRARLAAGGIEPVFQAIVSVETGRAVGAEALSRFPGSELTPEQWFHHAAEVGLGVELELAALRGSLAAAERLPAGIYLSVNVSPQTLVSPELRETIALSRLEPRRLVLEITEHASIVDYEPVLTALAPLRAAGTRVAVDDAGAGYASFRHILKLAPEFIKLDRSLIAGMHNDAGLRALAAAVVAFGSQVGASVIAEGVETRAELRCARTLGIGAAQGYLFGRPTADWSVRRECHDRRSLASGVPTPRPTETQQRARRARSDHSASVHPSAPPGAAPLPEAAR